MRFAKLYVWVSCSDNRPAVYIIMVVEVCLFLQGANTSLSLYCYLLSGSAGAGLQIPHDRSPSDISWLRQDAAPYIFCLSSPRRNGHAHADACGCLARNPKTLSRRRTAFRGDTTTADVEMMCVLCFSSAIVRQQAMSRLVLSARAVVFPERKRESGRVRTGTGDRGQDRSSEKRRYPDFMFVDLFVQKVYPKNPVRATFWFARLPPPRESCTYPRHEKLKIRPVPLLLIR